MDFKVGGDLPPCCLGQLLMILKDIHDRPSE